jgi:1-deoxy-D-xylulose-5-phosphate reductoisomerase
MTENNQLRKIAILGSTGSIGTQALEVIRSYPKIFSAEILTTNSNAELLIEQALEFQPNAVVIADETKYQTVSEALKNTQIKVFAGEQSVADIVQSSDVNLVLIALVGFSGLKPALSAVKSGKHIALATKEVLVVAGDLITKEAEVSKTAILPVDSEHSAILQCLVGEHLQTVEKVILTASGGPFRGLTHKQLEKVTIREALNHPNWSMGKKISIDSASMMNKGLEVIEAGHLFNLRHDEIDVVVHPQSIIHSMVQFCDGSVKAQLGLPDMRQPILYAFGFPYRLPSQLPRMNWNQISQLTFEKPDTKSFPCLGLAYTAMKGGGIMPCILNAANEIAVEAFLTGKITFTAIPHVIEDCMNHPGLSMNTPPNVDDFFEADKQTRMIAGEIINNKYLI